ncbi:MAG: hypothetical protein D6767_04325 [Candidatus Hydrogenedentota bacterium]|nr:MAG: hypothetical protein D6767_04325 [Candidatus Hydrogenedentota bacterium]
MSTNLRMTITMILAFLFLACGKEQTKFLDGEYLPKTAVVYTITAPSVIQTGEDFTITVEAKGANTGNVISWYSASIQCSAIGNGTITQSSESGFSSGRESITLRYDNPSLPAGGEETIVIQCVDSNNASYHGTSSTIKALAAPYMTGFKIEVPTSVYTDKTFQVTITALGNNGSTITSYNGTVNLSSAGGLGTLTPGTATLVNGVATISATYNAAAEYLTISATDGTYSGTSNTFSAGMGTGGNFSINLVAVPISASSIRLSWNPVPGATEYNLYIQQASGSYHTTPDVTIPTSQTYYTETGLTTGVARTYKLEVKIGGNVFGTATATATPKACTSVSGSIATNTIWDTTNSPYCISSSVTINSGVTLNIQAGSIVLFSSGTSLTVSSGATLTIEGNSTDVVLFTSDAVAPAPANYTGIVFNASANYSTFDGSNLYTGGSRLLFLVQEYGSQAVQASGPLDIEYCLFRYNQSASGYGAAVSDTLTAGQIVAIRYSAFWQNKTLDTNRGGAVSVSNGGTLIIEKSSFIGNEVKDTTGPNPDEWGGAIYVFLTTLDIDGSLFQSNMAKYGGAIFMDSSSNGNIQNTIFKQNVASIYGGVFYVNASSDVWNTRSSNNNVISKNQFTGNQATQDGGVFFFQGNSTASGTRGNVSQNQIVNNTFDGSSATQIASGHGGILAFATGQYGQINNNQIKNNYIKDVKVSTEASFLTFVNNGVGSTIDQNDISNNLFSNMESGGYGTLISFICLNNTSGGASLSNNLIQYNTIQSTNSTSSGSGMFYFYRATQCNNQNNTVQFNAFNQVVVPTGAYLYIITASNGNAYGIQSPLFKHNNFVKYGSEKFFSINDDSFAFQDNYWDGITPGSTCATTTECDFIAPSTLGAATITNPATTAWPTCIASPSDANCVGSHDLCSNNPSDTSCVGKP